MTRLARRCGLAAAIVLAGVAAGCGGSGSTTTGGAAGTAATASGGTTVVVKETEYTLSLSTMKLKPGPTTFVAENTGTVGHALEISGPGVSGRRTSGTIQSGGTARLTVTLKKGTYEIFCPIPGHKALGMDAKLTVGGGGSASSGGSAWG